MSVVEDEAGGGLEVFPSPREFSKVYKAGKPQVVYRRMISDLLTPVSAYLKLAKQQANSFILESVEGGATRGRYTVIGFAPDLVWRAHGERAQINRDPIAKPSQFNDLSEPTLSALRTLLAESAIDLPDDLPPMAAGVFGYMGYDTIRLVEDLRDVPPDVLEVPDSILVRPTMMVIFDLLKDEITLVTPIRPTKGVSAKKAFGAACARLEFAVAALESTASAEPAPSREELSALSPVSNTTEARYLEMVARAQEYIVAGDIFQVVLSQRFSTPFSLSSFALYRSLRRLNPSPFLFHLDFGDFALVGSSPEILVRVRDGEVTIRPIAGTRPRGANAGADKALEVELLADPKECSEHLMLLDLGRNDIGRVAEIGSIDVTDQFIVERYSHVMHIVSNVIGKLDKKYDAVDALMGGSPAGTVSGAPKVRAMEIIDELETSKRGPYAGCVGYFSADGNMDTCIVLRTGVVKDGMLHVQAGAGIVYDSIPENEQQECVNKAKALVSAAEDAVQLASQGRRRGKGGKDSGNGGAFG